MRTALITGGNSGIGKETARALVGLGWRVLIAARDSAKSASLVHAIRAANPQAQIDWLPLDLSNFESIEAFAAEVARRMPVIDALILNAGLYTRQLTTNKAGYEMMFAVTHLGHFLLTHHLLPHVQASHDGRIVVSSSLAQWVGGRMDLDTVRRPSGSQFLQLAPLRAYGRAKLANMLFVRELAQRLQGTSVKVNGFHPGGIKSDFWRDTPSWVTGAVDPFLLTEAKGAKTQIYLASHGGLWVSGEYWATCRVRRGSPANRDAALARKLWDYSEQVFGIKDYGQPALPQAQQMKAG